MEAKELNVNPSWVGLRFYQPNIDEVLRGAMTNDTPVTYYVKEQRYPKEGKYRSFLKNLVNQINIQYDREIKQIDTKNKILYFSNGEYTSYDRIISTIPLPEIIKFIPQAPDAVRQVAANLHATKVAIVSFGFKRPDIPKNLWFYVYDEEILFARVYSPSRKSPNNTPSGCSSLQAEIYFSHYKPLETMIPKGENIAQYCINHTKEKFIKMGICKADDIICEDFRILPYGNVIFTHGMEKNREIVLDYLRENGIVSCGRFGEWGYLWSHASFLSGMSAVDKIFI